jgi:RND superfamily putative drug exporter
MTLIPALMTLLGARAWWLPKWLDRIIPNLDIEGTAIERAPGRRHVTAPGAGSVRPTAPSSTA